MVILPSIECCCQARIGSDQKFIYLILHINWLEISNKLVYMWTCKHITSVSLKIISILMVKHFVSFFLIFLFPFCGYIHSISFSSSNVLSQFSLFFRYKPFSVYIYHPQNTWYEPLIAYHYKHSNCLGLTIN